MNSPGFLLLPVALVLGLAPLSLHAQSEGAPAAQFDNSLRTTLESAYDAWRRSIDTGDLTLWEQSTAFSRQIQTRNLIVSQKQPFPQALFDDPIGAPSLGGLIPLGVLTTGDTATSTYFGKANFGDEPGVAITDNLLVLHFLREEGVWKFDNLRIVKPAGNAELLLQIRNSDFSFLRGEEFQPAPYLPPIPQPVDPPQYVAEAWIDATGYEVKLTVNGHLIGTFKNLKTTELVIGGAKRGENRVQVEARLLPEGKGSSNVEIAIYAAEDPAGQAQRVYHFKPGSAVPPLTQDRFVVGQ